jgi:pyrroline-5-carboxylate reductase
MRYELGILGAGNMARGVLHSGLFAASAIIASDVNAARREVFSRQLGIQTTESNAEVASQSSILLVSVKPYQVKELLGQLGNVMNEQTLVVSIAAGVKAASIESALGHGRKWRVVRTMPNTPMLVGEGMVAISAGTYANTDDLATARRIFESAARVLQVHETMLDAVTAVSGSGPAYLFYLVENMIEAGTQLGLTREQSATLAIQTCAGAVKMLAETNESPAELRRRVTTPNGTTHAAISHMESKSVGPTIIEAIKAAAKRSAEMGA